MNNITSFQINTLVFDQTNFILQEVRGLESPMVRLPRYNLPGASGAFISNALYGERSIKIKGVVNSSDGTRSTYVNNRTLLVNAFAITRDVNNNLVPQTFLMTLANGQILTFSGFVDTPLQMGFSMDQSDWEEFQVSFVCPDPNIYSNNEVNYSVSVAVGGGTAIPTPIPISLAPSSGGSVTVTNIGSNVALPVITLTAPLTNPYIANLTINEFLSLNLTMNLGDNAVVINCANQTIVQGSNDISTKLNLGSTFWGLFSGNNQIGFSAAAGTGSATISFFPSFTGV